MIPRRVRITSALDSNWREVLEDVYLKAIPVKYISSVDIKLKDNRTYSIDVSSKLKTEWNNNSDEASKNLEQIIEELHDTHGIKLVEYLLDFDMIKSEISFTSSRLGNENKSDNN